MIFSVSQTSICLLKLVIDICLLGFCLWPFLSFSVLFVCFGSQALSVERRLLSVDVSVCSSVISCTTVACQVYFMFSNTRVNHWLNVAEWIEYKLAVMIHRCLEDKAPTYLSDYCIPVTAVSSRHLRSVNQHQLTVPRCRGITFGHRAFSMLLARWSGTHYRLSFTICLSILLFSGALLRRYYWY